MTNNEIKKFVYIIGAQASGKMTIGEELSKITGLKLFHNHMTVELANHFYGFDKQHKASFSAMRDDIRKLVFSNVAKSSLNGIIFTVVMYFDSESDYKALEDYSNSFIQSAKEIGSETEFYYVELICDIEERQKRNITANRLEKKPTKRNTEWTKLDIEESSKKYRLNSNEEDIKRFKTSNYLKIDNTNLSAEEVAQQIKKEFKL